MLPRLNAATYPVAVTHDSKWCRGHLERGFVLFSLFYTTVFQLFFVVPFPSVAFSDREDPGQSGTLHASFRGDFLVREARQFSEDCDNSVPELIREGGRRTLRALLTDSPLTPTRDSTEPLKKPDYLFGDSIDDPDNLCRGSEIWLNEHEGAFLFLPPFPR